MMTLWLIYLSITICFATDPAIEEEEIRARAYLQQLNLREAESANRVELANWAYDSNITDENLQNQVSGTLFCCFRKKQYFFNLKNLFRQYITSIPIKMQITLFNSNILHD